MFAATDKTAPLDNQEWQLKVIFPDEQKTREHDSGFLNRIPDSLFGRLENRSE